MHSLFRLLPATALVLAGVIPAQPADPVDARVGGLRGRVVVPATPEHPFPSEGTTLRLRDGRLIHVFNWRAQPADNQPWHPHYVPTVLGAVYSTDEGASWTPPGIYLKSASRTASHPSLVYLANGELGLSYNRIDSDTRAFKVFRHSRDEGKTWSEEIVVSPTDAYWTSAHDRLIVHSSGRLLQPLHTKTTPRTRASTVAWSDDHGRTWTLGKQRLTVTEEGAAKGFTGDRGFHEVSIAERADRSLFMIGRTHTGFLYSSNSSDRGETWSEPSRTDLVSPAAPARVQRLPNSPDLLLIWTSCCVDPKHWAMGPRFTLTAAISPDGGATWPYRRDLEAIVPTDPLENGVAYTSIYADRGTVFLAYHVALRSGRDSKGVQYGVALPLSWFYVPRDYPEPRAPRAAGGRR